MLRDPEDVAGKVQLGEGRGVAGVESVQGLVEVGRQGTLKSNGGSIRETDYFREKIKYCCISCHLGDKTCMGYTEDTFSISVPFSKNSR